MKYIKYILIAALLALTGCAHEEYDRKQALAVESAKNISITCADANECNVKWSRAQQWLAENSYFKLRIVTDSIITTEGPLDQAVYSMNSAISVNKISTGNGAAKISFKSWCANEYGCVPSHEMLLVDFANFVNTK